MTNRSSFVSRGKFREIYKERGCLDRFMVKPWIEVSETGEGHSSYKMKNNPF